MSQQLGIALVRHRFELEPDHIKLSCGFRPSNPSRQLQFLPGLFFLDQFEGHNHQLPDLDRSVQINTEPPTADAGQVGFLGVFSLNRQRHHPHRRQAKMFSLFGNFDVGNFFRRGVVHVIR